MSCATAGSQLRFGPCSLEGRGRGTLAQSAPRARASLHTHKAPRSLRCSERFPQNLLESHSHNLGKRHLKEAHMYAVCLGGFLNSFSLCGW